MINELSLIRGQGPSNDGKNETNTTRSLAPPKQSNVANYLNRYAEDEDPVEDDSGDALSGGTNVANYLNRYAEDEDPVEDDSGDAPSGGTNVANYLNRYAEDEDPVEDDSGDAPSGGTNVANYLNRYAEDEDPVEDDSGDARDGELQALDNLPPWELLQREWSYDENTPLGRVIVRAPWRTTARPPLNYRQAAQRGVRSTSRLTTTQQDAFQAALDTYIDRRFCAVVQCNSADDYKKSPPFEACQKAWDVLTRGTCYEGTTVMRPKHYTPAHTVFRDQHPTTPCRIVLDYRVLNRYLLRGGRSQHDLQGTLLQVRGFKYFVASDISKAFCQMKSSLYDLAYTNYTCIGDYTVLWSSVAFGTTSAPNFLECSTHDISLEAGSLRRLGASLTTSTTVDSKLFNDEALNEILLRPSQEAFDYVRSGPAIPRRLTLLKYVDDLFNGGDTQELALKCNSFSLHLLGGHGFKADAIKNVQSWTKAATDDTSQKSLLGYHYHNESLYVVYSGDFPHDVTTKREACSALASLYDPLGLLLEYDLKGRLIWRRICEQHKAWSETLHTNVANDVSDWIAECTIATKVGIPRHVSVNQQPLLVCTDASCDLWGVDIRCTDATTVSPRLLSRGGVFPKGQTKWTIPRKELVALYKGLQLLKAMSPYLPVPSYYKPHHVPLDPLAPVLEARQVRLLCDSEITIYRLRRPANDKRLPAVERRRLVEIRKLCKELDVIVLHVPSALNYADSISRAKAPDDINGSEVLNSLTTTKVIYDYRSQPDEFNEDSVESNPTTTPSVLAINEDGIDLPEAGPLPDDQRQELEALMNYAKPTDRITSGLFEDSQYTTCVTQCVLRSQQEDEDICGLKAILQGTATMSHFGVRATRLQRLARVCFLDDDGLLRRYPEPHRLTEPHNDKGVLCLGRSLYSAFLVRVLATILHYLHGHLGTKRVHILLRRDYWRDSMFKLVRLTIGSCVPCLKARATRQHNYLVTQVQTLLTEALWQLVGIDIAGPYGRQSTASPSSSALGDDSDKDHYILLVHDYVSGFTVARPMRNSKSTTVAAVLDSIFLEHGSPAVLLTDNDRTILSSKAVKLILARHGTKHYLLPSYSYYLGFWERAHKDFVQVTRALQSSRPITGPEANTSVMENAYIADYLIAVRAYNHTPRLWANTSPFELHYGYAGRLPGLHPEMDNSVDWDTLNVRYSTTDIVDYVHKNIPLLTEAREKIETTLGEYLELWRIKQQHHLQRYATDNPNDYDPKLFDLVFTTKRSDTSIGNHLQTYWSGPYTIVELQGSSMVKVIHGILLEGVGGVEAGQDRTTAIVPLIYGASESFSLKNVVHASALQETILNYYRRSQRAYLDSDGTLRTMKLTTPSQPNDATLAARARDQTALRHARHSTTTSAPSDENADEDSMNGAVGSGTPTQPSEEGQLEAAEDCQEADSSDSRTSWATPPAADDIDGPLDEAAGLPEAGHGEVSITKLQDHFGVSRRPIFGMFMDSIPTMGSVVASTTAPHIGLAKVVDDAVGDDYIKLQALDVVEEDGIITTPELSNIDPYNVDYHSTIYVRPTTSTWTRTRGKQLRELLTSLITLLTEA